MIDYSLDSSYVCGCPSEQQTLINNLIKEYNRIRNSIIFLVLDKYDIDVLDVDIIKERVNMVQQHSSNIDDNGVFMNTYDVTIYIDDAPVYRYIDKGVHGIDIIGFIDEVDCES